MRNFSCYHPDMKSLKIPKEIIELEVPEYCENMVPRICLMKQIHSKLLLARGEWRITLNKCLLCKKKERLLMTADAMQTDVKNEIKKKMLGHFSEGTCKICGESTYVSSKQKMCRKCIQLKSVRTKKEGWLQSKIKQQPENLKESSVVFDHSKVLVATILPKDKTIVLDFSKYNLDDLYVKITKSALDDLRNIEDQILFLLKKQLDIANKK